MARSRQRGRASATQAADVAKVVRDNWKKVRAQAGEQATAFTRSLREHGRSVIKEEKSLAAEEIHNLSTVVRRAADQLQDHQSPTLAAYVDTAARRIDGVAEFVEDLDVAKLTREVEQIARRRPALVVGGMFLAGLAISRFIKAGQAQVSQSEGSSSRSMTRAERRR